MSAASTPQDASLTQADRDWFAAHHWDAAAIPPATADNAADYRRREAALNAAIAHLSVTERGDSREGRLAAAIGARLADLRDPEDD